MADYLALYQELVGEESTLGKGQHICRWSLKEAFAASMSTYLTIPYEELIEVRRRIREPRIAFPVAGAAQS